MLLYTVAWQVLLSIPDADASVLASFPHSSWGGLGLGNSWSCLSLFIQHANSSLVRTHPREQRQNERVFCYNCAQQGHFGFVSHPGCGDTYMWQSRAEGEHYSIAYFDRVAAFKVLYLRTSVKGEAHMCCVEPLHGGASIAYVSPTLNLDFR